MSQKLSELKLPIILIAEIVLCLLFGEMIDENIKSFFYSISLTMKGILLTLLPFIIFSFLVSSMSDLKKGALSFVALAFIMVCCSNFISTSVAGFLGVLTLDGVASMSQVQGSTQDLLPMWSFNFPKIISNDTALFIGIGTGILLSLFNLEAPKKWAQSLQKVALTFLKNVFIPVIPVFILGFIFKIQHDGVLELIFKDYLSIFLIISAFAYSYIVLLYGIATNFKISKWLESIRNMVPAMLTGFSTMSSASALPLITDAAEKNTNDPKSRGVVPITVNIHLIGDCFSISILALAIMVSFGFDLPSLENYLIFTGFFVLAKFAVAAVPGGGILVMLPVLEKYLGFSGEMLSLITALYILFDPIITSANVMGNGAFAMLFSKVYKRFGIKKGSLETTG